MKPTLCRRLPLMGLALALAHVLILAPGGDARAQAPRTESPRAESPRSESPRSGAVPDTRSPVVLLFSVGGVLTADGTLWQYRPDLDRWMTIDEAFEEQGRETHVLPLPVAAGEIVEMSTFGFLRTRGNQLWLYDIERDNWSQLPDPGPAAPRSR